MVECVAFFFFFFLGGGGGGGGGRGDYDFEPCDLA